MRQQRLSARPTGVSVSLIDATVAYDRHPALHHIRAEIPAGSLVALVGPNGAGKSTLLKAVLGTLPVVSGTVVINGGRKIAYLPQRSELDLSFPISVFDFVGLGLWAEAGAFRAFGSARKRRIAAAIATVGLEGFERRSLASLSGGQLQRVLFARLLLQDAPLILLDEPFTAIDEASSTTILMQILRWHREGRTIVAAMHDFELVRRHFPMTLLLARRLVAAGQTAETLTPDNLIAARGMAEAWDTAAPICQVEEAA